MTNTCAIPSPPVTAAPVPTRTRILYGLGSIAYGIKDNGFSAFLMIFYNQVMGLPTSMVGLAIFLALVADAFLDPLIGHLSDNTKSRWGRRHPFIYGCALPASLFYMLLWFPPEGSDTVRFFYLLGTAFIVRATISCFEITSSALLPELTQDYDERTTILAWRYMFAWTGNLCILIFSYLILLVATPEYPVGQANRDGYETYAYIAAAIMVASIVISGLGTHHRIPTFAKAEEHRETAADSFRAILIAYQNRAFRILMLGGVIACTMQGAAFVLFPYLYSYYWGFSQGQIGVYFVVLIPVAVLAAIIAPQMGKRMGKCRALTVATLLWGSLQSTAYIGGLLGWMPAPGSTALMIAVYGLVTPGVCMGIVGTILSSSIMADIVEDHEETSGKRTEGIFFAGNFFMQKCTSGLGILLAGLILTAINFPEQANPATLGGDVKSNLALCYAILTLAMCSIAAAIFTRHPHTREAHQQRLNRLTVA